MQKTRVFHLPHCMQWSAKNRSSWLAAFKLTSSFSSKHLTGPIAWAGWHWLSLASKMADRHISSCMQIRAHSPADSALIGRFSSKNSNSPWLFLVSNRRQENCTSLAQPVIVFMDETCVRSIFFEQATFVHVQKVAKDFLHWKFFCTFKNVFFGM